MYLTRLLLERRAVRNPYNIHRLLWRAFPGVPDDTRPFLYRPAWDSRQPLMETLMLSELEPRPIDEAACRTVGIRAFEPRLREGQMLRFALLANPTKRLSKERCRVPLIREDEQKAWLERQLREAARPSAVTITAQHILHFRKAGRPGKVVVVGFEGLLERARGGPDGPRRSLTSRTCEQSAPNDVPRQR